jgi:hypothetical protein
MRDVRLLRRVMEIGVDQQSAPEQDVAVGRVAEDRTPLRPYIYAAGTIRLAFYLGLLAPRSEVGSYIGLALYVFTAPYFLLSVGAAMIVPREGGSASGWHGSWGLGFDTLEFVVLLLVYTTLGRRCGPTWAARVLILLLVGVGTAAILVTALVGASRL